MIERFDTKQFFLRSLIAVGIAHALDLLTTLYAQHAFGACEGNPFLASLLDGCSLLTLKAIATKTLGTAFYIGPSAAILWYMSKSWLVTSIPVLMLLAHIMTGPVENNLALILFHTLQGV